MKRTLSVLILIMTALNTTFCTKVVKNEVNPLLADTKTPYGVPAFDLIEPEHYEPASLSAYVFSAAAMNSSVKSSAVLEGISFSGITTALGRK